jgi:hypothetical protein
MSTLTSYVFGILSSAIHRLSVQRYVYKGDPIIAPRPPSSLPVYSVLRQDATVSRVTNANLYASRESSIRRS